MATREAHCVSEGQGRGLHPLEEIARGIPYHRNDIRRQLSRAATSILLNLAEGANEFTLGEKAKYFRYARRSAGECDATIDALECAGLATAKCQEARAQLREVGLMVSALIHRDPPR